MVINYSLIFLISFLLGIFFTVFFRRFALKYNILSHSGIPHIGGISMGLSFTVVYLLTFLCYRELPHKVPGIIISSFIILIFGIVDDWKELSIMAKFAGQIIAASLLILFGVRTHIVYIGDLLNIILTFIWVLGITNAFNHLDITDGLAAGAAVMVSAAFFIISILNGDFKATMPSLALAGAVFGFLMFNFPPAKNYMGNSGSHFLGFVLSAIALMISYAPLERKVALISPLLILGLPIFDTTFLILARLRKNKLPFKKSNDHLVLRFLALGYTRKNALLIMLALGLFFSISGILLSQVPNILCLMIIISVFLVSLFLIIKMGGVDIDG